MSSLFDQGFVNNLPEWDTNKTKSGLIWICKSKDSDVIEHRLEIERWYCELPDSLKNRFFANLRSEEDRKHIASIYELFFFHYLTLRGCKFRYEVDVKGKTPDYTLYNDSDKPIAVLEITFLEAEHPRGLFSPSVMWEKKIKSEIRNKANKYRGLNLPLIIAICADERFLDKIAVRSALYGKKAFIFEDFNGTTVNEPTSLVNQNSGLFTAFKSESNDRTNTAINTVILCKRVYQEGRWKFIPKFFNNPFASSIESQQFFSNELSDEW